MTANHPKTCYCDVCLEILEEEAAGRYLPSSSSSSTKREPVEPETRTRRSQEDIETLEEVDPPTDSDGEILAISDIEEALRELKEKERSIDADAQRTNADEEQQANRVRNLHKRYKERRSFLESLMKQAKRYAQYQRDLLGYRVYGFDAETDKAISHAMDEAIEDYFEQVDDLKDVVAKRIRACLDTLGPEVNDTKFRERLYRELHVKGVMGDWEPMEF